MFDKPATEIPAAVREIAEKNVEQTRAAYNQFQQMARQATDMLGKAPGDTNRASSRSRARLCGTQSRMWKRASG